MAIIYDETSDSYYNDGTSQTEVGPVNEGESGVYPIESSYNQNTTPSSGEYRSEVTPAPAISVEEAMAVSAPMVGAGFSADGQWTGTRSERDARDNLLSSRTLEDQKGGSGGDSFFSKLANSFKTDLSKNPMSYLKMGLDGFAGAQKSQATVDAAKAAQQGRLEQQNNQAALEQQAKDKYTASFGVGGAKPISRTQAPLQRTNGTPIYDLQGNVKGYK